LLLLRFANQLAAFVLFIFIFILLRNPDVTC
jgi:hypothetical protein